MRAGEFGGEAVERVDVLAEERGWDRSTFGVFETSYSSRNCRDGFDQSTLLAFTSLNSIFAVSVMTYRDACRSSVNAAGATVIDEISPGQQRVHAVGVGLDLVLAAADELGPHSFGDPLLDVEHRRVVHEHRDADDLDVRRQERAAAGERIAAARQRRAPSASSRRSTKQLSSACHVHQLATMLTSRPPATTTFFTVLPSRCFTTCGSASASSRSRSSERVRPAP